MLGLYFHWSFCLSKCIYCDFGSRVLQAGDNLQKLQADYCNNCIKQLHYFANRIKNTEPLTTIYFGGGTPSILDAQIVDTLITEAKNTFGLTNDCEITLEANPTTFEIKKFEAFRKAGINRLSLGVQSFDDKNLAWLGRRHTAKQAQRAIEEIKKIFPRWSFDLIYGLPKQTLSQWKNELNIALETEPQHLSMYTLIVDDNTLLGEMVKRGIVIPKTEDELADFYEATNEFIATKSNLKRYEVSNYCLQGHESRHNLGYWKSYDYVGIGAGAHGRLVYKETNEQTAERYEIQNIFNPFDWSKNLTNLEQNTTKNNGLEIERQLTQEEQIEEILLMGLRIKDGVDLKDISTRFDIDLIDYLDKKKIKRYQSNGLVLLNDDRLALTNKGTLLLDTILKDMLLA